MKYNPKIVIAYWLQEGLPAPLLEYKFHPGRKWRFDFAWMESVDGRKVYVPRLALEVEGGVWVAGRHTRGSGFVKDMEKYNEAAAMGFRILRVVPDDLCMLKTVKLIKRCL